MCRVCTLIRQGGPPGPATPLGLRALAGRWRLLFNFGPWLWVPGGLHAHVSAWATDACPPHVAPPPSWMNVAGLVRRPPNPCGPPNPSLISTPNPRPGTPKKNAKSLPPWPRCKALLHPWAVQCRWPPTSCPNSWPGCRKTTTPTGPCAEKTARYEPTALPTTRRPLLPAHNAYKPAPPPRAPNTTQARVVVVLDLLREAERLCGGGGSSRSPHGLEHREVLDLWEGNKALLAPVVERDAASLHCW